MGSKMSVKILMIGAFLVAGSLYLPSEAYARWGHGRSHHGYHHHRHYPYGSISVGLPHGYISIGYGGEDFFYGGGLFYQQHQREYIVVPPPSGVVVYDIPSGHQKVIIDGAVYYVYNGVYYVQAPQGYQVVQPPATVVLEPATVAANVTTEKAEVLTVNIPNSKGAYTAVTLKRSGNGFIGPQGEFYAEFPKVEQLKVMYGK